MMAIRLVSTLVYGDNRFKVYDPAKFLFQVVLPKIYRNIVK